MRLFPDRRAHRPSEARKGQDPGLATPAPRIPAQSERKTTQGNYGFPRSIAENLSLLTHAELAFVVITLRRTNQSDPATLDDDLWVKWTGLKPRSKRLAIEGLKEKGLDVRGNQRKPEYYFDLDRWESYVKPRPIPEKARSAGHDERKKPAMHPDCIKNGCQKACESQTCDTITVDAKVVSIDGSEPQNSPENTPRVGNRLPTQKIKSLETNEITEKRKPSETAFSSPSKNLPHQLTELLGIFIACGVLMNDRDNQRCLRAWDELTDEQQATALAFALARHADKWSTCAERYVPRPWNYLEGKQWDRKGIDRHAEFFNREGFI